MTKTKTAKERARRAVPSQPRRVPTKKVRVRAKQGTSAALFAPKRDVMDSSLAPVGVPKFRGPRARPRASRRSNYGVHPLVSAAVDPFSEDANCQRYPDEFQGLSGCFDVRQPAVITSNPAVGTYTDLNMVTVAPNSGQTVFLINPDPSNLIVNGIVGTKTTGLYANVPSTFYWPNGLSYTAAALSRNSFGPGSGVIGIDNPVTNITLFREMYASARLVSGGVKIVGTQNFSTVSGVIHMAPVFVSLSYMQNNNQSTVGNTPANNELANGWQVALPAGLSAMSQLPGYMQVPMSTLETDAAVFTFRRSGSEALAFKPTGTAWGLTDDDSGNLALRHGADNLVSSYGHYSLLVYIEGALTSTGGALPASTALGEMEFALHYECQPNPQTVAFALLGIGNPQAGTQLASRAPPNQPLLMAAADNFESAVPALRIVDDADVEEASFMAEVEKWWGVATQLVQSLGPAVNIIGPILSSFVL
jgi:hypothetical protein